MNIRSLVLIGMFAVLVYVAMYRLPGLRTSAEQHAPAVPAATSPVDDLLLRAPAGESLIHPISHISTQFPSSEEFFVTEAFSESTLWLARAIYSETKRPHEQELVAWVVRNRVETAYRGETTYKGVVLDPYQFSAFNPGAPRRAFLMSLTPEMQIPRWHQSLWIAYYVRHADPRHRPFSVETRHFFSEVSMRDRMSPYWADMHRLVPPGLDYEVEEDRFRFYERIS